MADSMNASVMNTMQVYASNVVIPVQQGASPAVYCIHPSSGDIEYAYKLSAYWGKEQSVYGIAAPCTDGVTPPFETIEEAAKEYIRGLLAVHTGGPINLIGYSYGGLVAFEMACQLVSRGYSIQNLFIIDAYNTGPGHTYLKIGYKYIFLSTLRLLFSVRNWKDFFRNHYHQALVRRAYSLTKRIAAKVGFRQLPAFEASSSNQFTDTLCKAYAEYKPRIYPGQIIFIRAGENMARYLKNSDFGWRKYALGGVMVHDISGVNHNTLFMVQDSICQTANLTSSYLKKSS